MTKKSTKRKKIVALCIFIIVFISLILFLFSGENFDVLKEIFNSNASKEQIQDSIAKLGIRAYIVVFILSSMQVVLTFIPAEPLHVIAGISFGLGKGILVCLSGILVGNTIVYLLYKFFGTKLTDYFATNAEFDFKIARKSRKIALIVIILYCLPAIPYGIICFFAATLGMKYPKYILITGIGSIPSLFIDVGLGHITMATSWIVSIIVFIAIIVLLILMLKYKNQIFKKVNKFVKIQEEKAKNKVGNYSPIVYKVFGTLLLWNLKRKVKVKLKSNVKKIKKPCIVLCNHGSFYDFLYAGKLLMKYKPHFIVARLYFQNKKLAWVLGKTGAFPKSLLSTDIENSKNCLKIMNAKEVLAMMPEARLSTVGEFEGIQDATYKFIHKMGVSVYTVKINGAYLANPKWGDGVRKGAKVEAELNKLISSKEISEISIEDLKDRIDSALTYNEWEWLDSHPEIKFKHKTLAKGLENILCICPKCKSRHSLITDKNIITCEHCDLSVTLDNRYALSGVDFKNIAEWYKWQEDEFRQMLKEDNNFALSSEVELHHLSNGGKTFTKIAGHGVCTLDKSGLRYTGTDNGEEIEKFFEIHNIYRLLFGAGEDFEIYDGKEIYYFVPEDKRSCVEWYIMSKIFKEI